MKVFIKNMVCYRCVWAVGKVIKDLKLPGGKVELGVVVFKKPLTQKQLSLFGTRLKKLRLSILSDKKDIQVQEIKTLLIKAIDERKLGKRFSLSKYLSAFMENDYSHLSKSFSKSQGVTIEQYFILLRLEKVKEWLSYGELSLNEIAAELGYSSVQHLSGQFKKVVGISTSEFKKSFSAQRKFIDHVNVPETH